MAKKRAHGVYTWKYLGLLNREVGCLQLKYKRHRMFTVHLSHVKKLDNALLNIQAKLLNQGPRLTLHELIACASIDGKPLKQLLQEYKMKGMKTVCTKEGALRNATLDKIKHICRHVMRELGPSHTENVYELAICQELYAQRIPHVRQMPVCAFYDGKVSIPAGYIDIEIDHRFLLELKSGDLHERHCQQLKRYVSAMKSNGKVMDSAIVVCFQPNGHVLFQSV